MIKVPRLKTNRHGVFCVRVYGRDDAGRLRESLHSLGAKSATVARLLALQFNTAYEQQRAMTRKPTPPKFDDLLNKFELDISKGIMKAEGPEDFANMMQAMEAYKRQTQEWAHQKGQRLGASLAQSDVAGPGIRSSAGTVLSR